MLIELGYQLYIHACSGNYLGNIFLIFFLPLFFLDGGSGCLDGKVDSSGRPFSLSGRACLCDLLHGTTSRCHLSSVRTVNPVGLYHIPPALQPPHFIFFLVAFVVLCVFFFLLFMCASHMRLSSFQFISNLGIFLYPFTVLFYVFMLKIVCFGFFIFWV
jgi:hypothetical protein